MGRNVFVRADPSHKGLRLPALPALSAAPHASRTFGGPHHERPPGGAMWQIGHTARQSWPLPKRCPSRGAITTLDVVSHCPGQPCQIHLRPHTALMSIAVFV